MADDIKEEEVVEEKPEKKAPKSALGKLKAAILPDADEQAAIISTFVRMGVLVWSGGILTLNYVAIPGVPQQKIDPTFIASVFTGVLASFGIQTASKKGDGTMKMDKGGGSGPGGQISKKDMEQLIEKATASAPAQTIRIEQAPLIVKAESPKKDDKPYTM